LPYRETALLFVTVKLLTVTVNVTEPTFTLLYPDDKSAAGNFPDELQPTHQPTLYKINKHPVSFVGKCHATENLS
jgi:hypothetical protein